MLEQAARARLDPSGHQVIEVAVDHGYRPAVIRARADMPLRLLFRRDDDEACSERVIFSAPRLERYLSRAGTTTIDLPAQPPGAIRFTCTMGRYQGHIELAGEPRPVLARLREHASDIGAPLGTALVLWICSLPLIALVAILGFDARAAIVAASAALIAWVVGCLWAFGRTARST